MSAVSAKDTPTQQKPGTWSISRTDVMRSVYTTLNSVCCGPGSRRLNNRSGVR